MSGWTVVERINRGLNSWEKITATVRGFGFIEDIDNSLLSWEGSFMPEPDEFAANSMEEEDPFGVELKASLAVSFAI